MALDKVTRLSYPFTQSMIDQVLEFYFRNYLKHWSQPVFREALASIPHVGGLQGAGGRA